MSNPFKAIGKAFKAVVKVVKKIALPALAIGAAVLTGGAALGLGGIFAGGAAGAVGATGALATVITTAGQGALMGMLGSAVTGGNILKGASVGFLMGGATGALGVGTGLIKPAPTVGAGGVGAGVKPVDPISASIGPAPPSPAELTAAATQPLASASPSMGLGQALGAPTLGPTPGANIAPTAQPSVAQLSQAAAAPLPSAAGPITPVVSNGAPNILGGIGDFLSKNQYLAYGMLQGIGGGMQAKAQLDARREEEERAREDRNAETQRIRDNYSGLGGFFSSNTGSGVAAIEPRKRMVWKVNPTTGELYQEVA